MRIVAVTAVLLAAAACGGEDAGFSPSGCPVDDAALCERAVAAADALVAGDVDRLVELSRLEPFACDELPPDLFPDCAPGQALEGHAFSTSEPRIRILQPQEYRSRLAGLLERVDPDYSDERGSGELQVRGVGTCGPDDPAGRSYHLAFTAGLTEEGEESRRWLGSLELVSREGEWVVGLLLVDSVEAWGRELADPFAETACGNVRPWRG